MKALVVIIVGVATLVLSALLLVPVFFDADKHLKPYIERTVSDYLNVEAKIGRLSISLWGKVRVQVMGVELVDQRKAQSVFKVDEAMVEAPFGPLFQKKLGLTFVAKQPAIQVVSEEDGRLNWSKLFKKPSGAGAKDAKERGETQRPEFLRDFVIALSVHIENATLVYRDLVQKSETTVRDIDFALADFSTTEPFTYSLTARMNSTQPTSRIVGPVKAEGTVELDMPNNEYQGLETSGKINLDRLEINANGFVKQDGEPLNFAYTGQVQKNTAKFNIDSNLEALAAESVIEVQSITPMRLTMDVSASQIDFKKLFQVNATLTDVAAKIKMTDKLVQITESQFKVYKGQYNGTANIEFGKKKKVNARGKVTNIDVNEAITSQMPDFKDTLKGSLSSDYNITTSGVESKDFKNNLSGGGHVRLKDGSWSALYGLKLVAEKLSAIPGVKERVSGLNVGDQIQTARSNFGLAGPKVILSDTIIDMKDTRATVIGSGEVGFNKQVRFSGFILAPLSNPPAALRYSDGRARLPFEITGAVNGPNINWSVTTDAVAKAYLRQEGEKLLDQVKDGVQDENLKKLLDKAPEGLDKLFKEIKL